jgi:hypothetical protein
MAQDATMNRPDESEFAPSYGAYVSLVPETDIMKVLDEQTSNLVLRTRAFIPAREQFRYAEGKWSVREVLGHVADGERVFGYRLFCISRGDQTPLPGFDEKEYVARSGYDQVAIAELVDDFSCLRESNLTTLRRLDAAAWQRRGMANGNMISVRALAYVMAGHVRHHLDILSSRYGGA